MVCQEFLRSDHSAVRWCPTTSSDLVSWLKAIWWTYMGDSVSCMAFWVSGSKSMRNLLPLPPRRLGKALKGGIAGFPPSPGGCRFQTVRRALPIADQTTPRGLFPPIHPRFGHGPCHPPRGSADRLKKPALGFFTGLRVAIIASLGQ